MSNSPEIESVAVAVARLQAAIVTHLGDGPNSMGHVYVALNRLGGQMDTLTATVGRLRGHIHGDGESGTAGVQPKIVAVEARLDALGRDVQTILTTLVGGLGRPGIDVRMAQLESEVVKLTEREIALRARIDSTDPKSPGVLLMLDRMTQNAERHSKWLWILSGGVISAAAKAVFDVIR